MTTAGRRCCFVATLAALVFTAVQPTVAVAQAVAGVVREVGTSEPLPGVLVSVLDLDGDRVRAVLTDGTGGFTLEVPLGRYRLRAERIGLRTATSDLFDLNTFNTRIQHVDMASRAVEIAGLVVDGRVQSCRIDPQEGARIQRWWQEIRTALDVSSALQREQFAQFQIEKFEREWDGRLRRNIGRESVPELSRSSRPFISADTEFLSEGGFVQGQTTGRREFYGPDADVLLSDAFLSQHCFSLVEGRGRRENLGLRFEPAGSRDVIDIGGTLWVDTTTAELQRLDYQYSEPEEVGAGSGGRIDFDYLESGAWIISEWYIRMPIMRASAEGSERPFVITGYRDLGGTVSPMPETDVDENGGFGAIRGGVVDNTHGRELANARVTLLESGRQALTDSAGEFVFGNVPVGRHVLSFTHEDLDLWGLGPPFATVRVRRNRTADVWLEVPRFPEITISLCLGEGLRAQAILVGHLLGADREGLAGVPIELNATEPSGGEFTLTTRTGPDGRFLACSLPGNWTVELRAQVQGRWIEAFELKLPPRQITYREVWITR